MKRLATFAVVIGVLGLATAPQSPRLHTTATLSAHVTPAPVTPPRKLITIDRSRFLLKLWRFGGVGKPYVLQRTYHVAVGKPGYATPTTVRYVSTIIQHPGWTAPNSDWVPKKDRGKFFDGNDPRNPIVAVFMVIGPDGLGIHGTREANSIGTRASHGCIRLLPKQVKQLARLTPVGTPVVIT